MEPWFQVVLTIFSSVLASSGLWAYLQKKSEQKDVKTEMLIGLAHDRIMYLGMSYIDRGCVKQLCFLWCFRILTKMKGSFI